MYESCSLSFCAILIVSPCVTALGSSLWFVSANCLLWRWLVAVKNVVNTTAHESKQHNTLPVPKQSSTPPRPALYNITTQLLCPPSGVGSH
ncbi:hypothetical protein DM02DRAFT_14108 [Periconia macrospinosa]|uniref:Uncharacterized protein n=1 Tax=Periconia macrospinosa TaxID=97972 RepID=A0A2V1E7I1_9PLEO|nr:hypothetical protein DM02DRAFT_14108 [Periconia macrospinosa]